MIVNKILIPDDIHINKKNYNSIFEFVKHKHINLIFYNDFEHIKSLYGNYKEYKYLFSEEFNLLKKMDINELYEYKFYGKNIFGLAKSELLSLLISFDNWNNFNIPNDNFFIFKKAFNENKEELLLNLSASIFWLKYWKKIFNSNKKNLNKSIALVFSGSLIYSKTFSFFLENTSVKVFKTEHFFTGYDFYFEEKYEHIANNSDIRFKNVYDMKFNELISKNNFIHDKKIAIKKIIEGKNKNVIQPENTFDEIFNNNKKNVLILGQVINDFSILESNLNYINSSAFYIELIENILKNTDYNIIFKAHPWENKKINLKKPLTKYIINNYLKKIDQKYLKRIIIVENYNLKALTDKSEFIVGLSSQSLLEAGFYSYKKVFQFGNAFFGHKGFTYDINIKDIKEFIKIIKSKNLDTKLNLLEYNLLIEFLTVLLQNHLLSNNSKYFHHNLKLLNKLFKTKNKNYINLYFLKYFINENKFNKLINNPKKFFNDSNNFFIKKIAKLI